MATDNELGEFHATAMSEHLYARSVALMLFTNGPDNYPEIGSGTCIKIGDRHFIATVAHNLNGLTQFHEVGIAALGVVGKFSKQTPKIVRWGRRGDGIKDPLDIAWLEILPAAVEPWSKLWDRVFVTLDRVSLEPVRVGSHVHVLGQPSEDVKPDKLQGETLLAMTPLTYLARVIEPPAGHVTGDMFLEYPPAANVPGGTKRLPKAPGLSGSGMWTINDATDSFWSPDHARLVGIEHCWMKDEYLRGNPMREWLQMVREDIPELAPEIDPFLAR